MWSSTLVPSWVWATVPVVRGPALPRGYRTLAWGRRPALPTLIADGTRVSGPSVHEGAPGAAILTAM
ncbi:hypothetical protein GCM10010249_59130 [Streptomyces roseolilacinus]|uniref:Uncharacterized protein n=1 Tax=Streptomyces roseolilacinus TaxID=66904 RepID=A0A918B6M3_9ACTN|nr:hypothetical protein GCM10010249_59130 [Streptomyces roseolilacinus]